MKTMGLMAMGAGAYMAYEKYKKPMKKSMKKAVNGVKSTASKKLDNMM